MAEAWTMKGTVLIACNCDYGCPCNFNALPTTGKCEGEWTWHVEEGAYDGTQLDGFVQVGVAKEDQPHYLKVLVRPGVDASPLVRYGLGVIAARTQRGGDHRHDHGVIAPVRTYESPTDRRLEEAGFKAIATVTLLMKENLVRVAEPALVPAGVR
jgi:hypothetical protein